MIITLVFDCVKASLVASVTEMKLIISDEHMIRTTCVVLISHTHTHTHTHTQSVVDWTFVWWLEASVSSSCHSVVSYWYIYQLNTSFTHKVHSKHHLLYTYWILLLCFSFVGTCDRNRYFYLLFISLILCLTLLFVFLSMYFFCI